MKLPFNQFLILLLGIAMSVMLGPGCAQPITESTDKQEEGNQEQQEHGEHGHGEGREHSHDERGEHGHGKTSHEHGGEGHGEHSHGEGHGQGHGAGHGEGHGAGHGEEHAEHTRGSRGEHAADHDGGGEGEEDGTELSRDEKYDAVRNGAHLVLAWDEESQSFKGTVKNVSSETLERVRVEVHFSKNAKRFEVGPTKSAELKPGESMDVTLTPRTKDFDAWSTHAEVGSEEHTHGHGHSERERGEHGEHREQGGEHGEREHRGKGRG